MKRSAPSLRVARALLADPDADHYGYPLTKAADVRSGVLYPILWRMLEAGWLEDRWEITEGKPPRRYYRVTQTGRTELERFVG